MKGVVDDAGRALLTLSIRQDAKALRDGGQPEEAEPLFREVITALHRKLGYSHPYTQTAIRNLITGYSKVRQPKKAESLCRELVEFWKENSGIQSPQYAGQLALFGQNLLERKSTDAEPILRKCLMIREKT